jgi:hypothetical protein
MKSWTRTLNLDDAHSLLALAHSGRKCTEWSNECHNVIPELSLARRRELIRLVRDGFLEWTADDRIEVAPFVRVYEDAPAAAQLDLVEIQWALSHPLTLIGVEKLVAPLLNKTERSIPLQAVEELVSDHVDTGSAESLRKTRTVLLGAMEGIGTITTRGTGQHRALHASRGQPHPLAFAYLLLRDLRERDMDGMMRSEAIESSLGARLTQCGRSHAEKCVEWSIARGVLQQRGDEIATAA